MYNIINVKTGETVLENATSKHTCEFLGIDSKYLSRYVNNEMLRNKTYLTVLADDEEEKDRNLVAFKSGAFYAEWKQITEYINSKVIWCKKGTEGARRIVLKPKNGENEK